MHTIGEFFVFFLVSLSAACLGWGIVVVASRIEHERQERYAERYGRKGPGVPLPKPSDVKPSPSWPISRAGARCNSLRSDRRQGLLANAQTCAPSPQVCPSSQCGRSWGHTVRTSSPPTCLGLQRHWPEVLFLAPAVENGLARATIGSGEAAPAIGGQATSSLVFSSARCAARTALRAAAFNAGGTAT